MEQTDRRETYHRLLWYDPPADPGGAVGPNRVWSNTPSLSALRKPSDVSVIPVGRVRPILVTIGSVARAVVVAAVEVGYCRYSLLEFCTLVRVDLGDRGVVDGRGRRVLIELVLVVEGGDLE